MPSVVEAQRGTVDARSEVRAALMSVYYASVGRELELRGAPSVLLPPEVRPLDLAEALTILKETPDFRGALWRLIRAVPVVGRRDSPASDSELLAGYPHELVEVIGRDLLREIDEARRRARRGAHLFVAALEACADNDHAQFDDVLGILRTARDATEEGFVHLVCQTTLGRTPDDLLQKLVRDDWGRTAEGLRRLERDVGLDLYTFVRDVADAAALLKCGFDDEDAPTTVYPVSSVIRQDSRTLTTTATVSTLVKADFEVLKRAVDPQGWDAASDVISRVEYITDPFTLSPLADPPAWGAGLDGRRLLEEEASLSWGPNADRQSSFHNVLRIDRHTVDPRAQNIEVRFSLSRSIRSRVMWDERAGGIVVNDGYVKVRHVVDDRWRVTSRKRLRFSDRTPYLHGQGWRDVGQTLNFLAPAALAWWMESETYSLAADAYRQGLRPGAAATA
jgi:hypothetical protein